MSGFILRDPQVLAWRRLRDDRPEWAQDPSLYSVSLRTFPLFSTSPDADGALTTTFRDTSFGHFVRWITRGKVFPYPYELNSHHLVNYMSTAIVPISTTTPAIIKDIRDLASTLKYDKNDAAPELINWLPDDPENPQNWSAGKKAFVAFQICLLTTSVYVGAATFNAGIPGIMEQFKVSETVALLGLSMFVLGYGIGPMFWSPLQEFPKYGKSPIYVLAQLLFVGLQPAVTYAPNIGSLLFFRFLTGALGSPILSTGAASLVDIYSPKKRGYAIAVFGIANVLGPVLGPLVGGFAAQHGGWPWPFWALMCFAGFSLVFVFFFLPETSGQTILYHRARRIRKVRGPGAAPVRTAAGVAADNKRLSEMLHRALIRPFTFMFTEPVVLVMNLWFGLVYACLYLFFESFPLVFVDMYGFTDGTLGLAFLGLLIGILLSFPPFVFYTRKYLEPQFSALGTLIPEKRLDLACFASFLIPVSLFWFGWSSGRTPWIVPVMSTGLFGIGTYLMFVAVLNYLSDTYTIFVASAFASNILVRSLFGAGFPLFASAIYGKLGISWGSSLLGFLSLLFVPVPFLFRQYGRRLRIMSKSARHD